MVEENLKKHTLLALKNLIQDGIMEKLSVIMDMFIFLALTIRLSLKRDMLKEVDLLWRNILVGTSLKKKLFIIKELIFRLILLKTDKMILLKIYNYLKIIVNT